MEAPRLGALRVKQGLLAKQGAWVLGRSEKQQVVRWAMLVGVQEAWRKAVPLALGGLLVTKLCRVILMDRAPTMGHQVRRTILNMARDSRNRIICHDLTEIHRRAKTYGDRAAILGRKQEVIREVQAQVVAMAKEGTQYGSSSAASSQTDESWLTNFGYVIQ